MAAQKATVGSTPKNINFKLSDVEPRYPVDIRAYVLDQDFYELRFWHNGRLVKVQKLKIPDFWPVHF